MVFVPLLLTLNIQLTSFSSVSAVDFEQVNVCRAATIKLGPNFFSHCYAMLCILYDALRDLIPLVQFKKRKKTHGGVLNIVKLQAQKQHSSIGVFQVF